MVTTALTPAHSLARQAAGAAAVTVLLTLVSLLTTPFILKSLGDASYGILTTITVVSSYLMNLEFGFGYATVRFLARASAAGDAATEAAVADTSQVVFATAALLGGCTLLLLARPLATEVFRIPVPLVADAQVAFTLGGLIVAASFTTTGHSVMIQAKGRLGALSTLRFLVGLASALAAVTSIALGGGLVAVVTAQTIVAWAGALGARALACRALGRAPAWRLHRDTFREMAGYSGLSFAAGIAYQVMMTGPGMVLAARVSTAELPPFAIPSTMLQRLSQLMAAASVSFFPFASAAATGDLSRLRRVFRAHTRLQLLLAGPVAAYLAAFGRPLLAIWISPDFAARAALPLTLMVLTALLLAVSSPSADVARACGRPAWVVAFTSWVAIVGITLAVPLSVRQGAAGAAAALAVSVASGAIPLMLIVAIRLMGLTARDLLADLAKPALIVGLAWLAWQGLSLVTSHLALMVAAGGALGTLYCFVAFAWLLEAPERQALLVAVGRRR